MQYYDMHTHILPNFDDGACDVTEALGLIECLEKQNIKNICLTPHFYSNEMGVEDFIVKRENAFNDFLPHIPSSINVVLGAEVYVSKYLFGGYDLSKLTYGKSKYILSEFNYSSTFSGKSLDHITHLVNTYGLIPVLPHIERYDVLMSDIELVYELKRMGVVIQTNIGNYSKKAPIFKRRKLIKYINDGVIDIIGSDTHSMIHNTPQVYADALDFIASKCGANVVEEMMQRAEEIFASAT